MCETGHQSERKSLSGGSRWIARRTLVLGVVSAIVITLGLVTALRLLRNSKLANIERNAAIPFRPKVTFQTSNVTITNTEREPYVDTRLVIYVGGTLYGLEVGTVRPGESITRSMLELKNARGEGLEPGSKTSELEVRARFGGYEVHKDFPPPP